jgi:hypothetical protein
MQLVACSFGLTGLAKDKVVLRVFSAFCLRFSPASTWTAHSKVRFLALCGLLRGVEVIELSLAQGDLGLSNCFSCVVRVLEHAVPSASGNTGIGDFSVSLDAGVRRSGGQTPHVTCGRQGT